MLTMSFSSNDLNNYLAFAQEAAFKGGTVLRKHWGKLKHVAHKATSIDLVTEADKESEETILTFIGQHFPEHAILSEEAGLHQESHHDYQWIIDPLDGTTNYTHQYPMVAISIALMIKEEPWVAIVYNPLTEELFQAVRNHGATLNHVPLKVSGVDSINNSLLASGFPYDRRENPDNNYAEFCALTHLSQGVRRGGSAALDLAFVAAGRLDGYWERGIKAWDIAAGTLLVTEAGGKVSAYDQTPLNFSSGRILASNGLIHEQLSRELLEVRKVRRESIN